MPTRPFRALVVDITPSCATPGASTPCEFGPTRRVRVPSRACRTRTMSMSGTRSVTHTTSGTPARIASIMAPAALSGGTNTRLALAPVAATAWSTVSNTGRSRCRRPPLPGVTPPTMRVP